MLSASEPLFQRTSFAMNTSRNNADGSLRVVYVKLCTDKFCFEKQEDCSNLLNVIHDEQDGGGVQTHSCQYTSLLRCKVISAFTVLKFGPATVFSGNLPNPWQDVE